MSSIVTFYSYKGGVGRTMALANVAVLLAQRKLRVLAVDWDLEAPGLERYFGYFDVDTSKGGLLQLLSEQHGGTRGHWRPHLARVSGTIDDTGFELDLLPSGRESDPQYSAKLERFDWEQYFKDGGGDYLEELRAKWREEYDVVLIDSRTGLSDTGGICTIQLPDVVVAMFTANHQSLYGVRDTMRLARSARDQLAYDRMQLRVLPLPSRFGQNDETPEALEWIDRIAETLAEFYEDWLPRNAAPRGVTRALKIPQVDAFGYGEKLAVIEASSLSEAMTSVYGRLADLLSSEVADASQVLHLGSRDSGARKQTAQTGDGYEYDVFVCHAAGSILDQWVDTFVARLREALRVELGREPAIFLDLSQVHAGEKFPERLHQSLIRSRVLLAIVTPEMLKSQWSRVEWATFEQRETANPASYPLIVPVLLKKNDALPEWVARREREMVDLTDRSVGAMLRDPGDLDEQLGHLARRLVGRARAAPSFEPEPTPFRDPTTLNRGAAIVRRSIEGARVQGPPERSLEADALTALLSVDGSPKSIEAAQVLMKELRSQHDFASLAKVTKALHERLPRDTTTTIAHAEALLETGHADEAAQLLAPLVAKGNLQPTEVGVATGVLGRAEKERFVQMRSTARPRANRALMNAILAFRRGYDTDRATNVWHGVNLVALLAAARRRDAPSPAGLNEKKIARAILKRLDAVPTSLRDRFHHVEAAEMQLCIGNWAKVEHHLGKFLATPDLGAMELNGVLRQLTEIWELDSVSRGAPLLDALRARLLGTSGGHVELPQTATRTSAQLDAHAQKLERVLGGPTAMPVRSLILALERTRSVGAYHRRDGDLPSGTCFLVAARDVGLDLDETVVLTASFVTRDHRENEFVPSDALVVFHGAASPVRVRVDRELWTSERLSCSILRLHGSPEGIAPLPLARELPSLETPQSVYVIGYPGGRELSVSLEDNELLDHEGPPNGKPATAGVVRLHYRTLTDQGSSGSPVFDAQWNVIGLHCSSGELERLNGRSGNYMAREGIWIQSIARAQKVDGARAPAPRKRAKSGRLRSKRRSR